MKKRTTIRAAALCFSALVPLCAAAAADAGATGDQVLLNRADRGFYDTDKNVLTVEGHVEIDYKGRILMADRVSYDLDADRATADGHVSLMDENGNVAFADHVVLTDQMRNGVLSGFGALLSSHGRLAAAAAERKQGRVTTARHAVYSNCKVCNRPGERTPLWQIKAFKVVHDSETHRITFDDATLEIMGVPMMYMPYLSMPDPTVSHASGLLRVDPGSSSAIGYFVRVPYYISLSDSEDATVEPLISTRGGGVLAGEYRERWQDSGLWLQGSVGVTPNAGTSENRTQYNAHLFGSGRFALDDIWQTGFDAKVSTRDTYLKRYDMSQLDRLTSDLFFTGEDGRSRLSVSGYFFQSLRSSDDSKTFPIALPLIEYSYVPLDKWWGGQFRFDANAVALTRDQGANDQRLSAKARWRYPFIASDGEMWTFEVDGRGDVYHTDTPQDASGKHFIGRGMPMAALDWRWPFISEGSDGRSVIVEPIAQFVAATYGGNPAGIPNEDSYGLEIDENNIFSFDQVPGYDLAESGHRANFGFRTEGRFPFGYVEAVLGQTFRLKSDPIFSDTSGQSGTSSDVVGRFSIKFSPYMDLTHRIAYDEKDGKVRRNEVYLTGIYGRSSLQVNYIRLSANADMAAREELNAQTDVNFYKNWQVFAAVRRDMRADQTLSSEFGLGYEDECLGISLAYRRKYTSDQDIKPSTIILLHFSLKTTDQPVGAFSLFPQNVFSYFHS